jgi:antitoxin YefM
MQVYSLTEARNNIKAMFDSVYEDNEEVIIHRKGRESVVVISLDDYNALKETNYLLASPANRKQLLASLKELKDGRGFERELLE